MKLGHLVFIDHTRDSNPEIPGSRTIFSIPNPGIGDVLIPGFWIMKNEQSAQILHDICQKNTFSPNFGSQFPALKLRVSGLDPNTKYVIKVSIVLRAQSY